jgi:hypothetical protein
MRHSRNFTTWLVLLAEYAALISRASGDHEAQLWLGKMVILGLADDPWIDVGDIINVGLCLCLFILVTPVNIAWIASTSANSMPEGTPASNQQDGIHMG